jgi:hypothetical protein
MYGHFQLTEALPWWFKRWVLFRKSAVPPELYQFEIDVHSETDPLKGPRSMTSMAMRKIWKS